MPSSSPLLVVAVVATTLALPRQMAGMNDIPVVTVEPACADWTPGATSTQSMVSPHIVITYNPLAPGARLASARSLTLVVAGKRGSSFEVTKIPMTRAPDGAWQTVFTAGGNRVPIPGYWILFLEDDAQRIDNNRAQYWDFLLCGSEFAAIEQAATYEGNQLAPGIRRAPDLARAADILKATLKQFPERYAPYGPLWRFELEQANGSPAAYEQVGRELDSLVTAHSDFMYALHQISSFVALYQQKLPPMVVRRFRDAVAALPQAPEFIMHDGTGRTYRTPRSALSPDRIQAIEREARTILTELDCGAVHPEPATCRENGRPK